MGLRVAEFNSTQKKELKVGSFMKRSAFTFAVMLTRLFHPARHYGTLSFLQSNMCVTV